MDKNTKALLVAEHIPPHVQNLLELVGVFFLHDLTEIDEAFLKNVEEQIRAGSVLNQINFASKINRIKYFGIDHHDVSSFQFRILDRIKLLRLPAAADEKLNDVQWIEEVGDESERPDESRLNRITLKIVDDSNAWLASTEYEHEVDRSHVSVSFGESGKPSFKVLCLICDPKKQISLNSTQYSASINNFTRHVSLNHIKKAASPSVKIEPKEPSSSTKTKKPTKKRNLLELLDSDGDIEESVKKPRKKKKAQAENPKQLPTIDLDDPENQQANRIAQKLIDDSNAFLSPSDLLGSVDRSHVTAFRGDSGKISYKIQCVVCGKVISVNATQYSASITNFKRHFETFHIEKADA